MASAARSDLEAVYGQLVSFSLLNVTVPATVDAALIDQQVNKRKVETATQRQKIQQIQGYIENLKNQGTANESNILAEANAYYDSVTQGIYSDVNREKYLAEMAEVQSATGIYAKNFPGHNAYFNQFCWYKKVSLML